MNSEFQNELNKYAKNRKTRKKWHTTVASLCAVAAVGTSYLLINPASTQLQETYCGFEEHKEHDDSCYEKVLACPFAEEGSMNAESGNGEQRTLICPIPEMEGHAHTDQCYAAEQYLACGMEESDEHQHSEECYETELTLICEEEEVAGHHHDDSCYEQQAGTVSEEEEIILHQHDEGCYEIDYDHLLCEVPIHEHTLQCFSNPESDVENASVWERSFGSAELSGDWKKDVIAIARTQIGYTESTANYEVQEDGTTMNGYTRYGAWYGDPYGDWDAMFCSFCLHYAGVDEDVFPVDTDCENWMDTLQKEEYNRFRPAGAYIPAQGDLIFFDEDHDGVCDDVGLVEKLDGDEKEASAQITTIEGNSTDCVCRNKYDISDNRILGFGVISDESPVRENPDTDDISESAEETEAETEAWAETESEMRTESETEAWTETETEPETIAEKIAAGLELITEEAATEPEMITEKIAAGLELIAEEAETESEMITEETETESESESEMESESDTETDCETYSNILTASGPDYHITVTYSEEAELPEDVELAAYEVLGEDQDELREATIATLGLTEEELAEYEELQSEVIPFARYFDLTYITKETTEVIPSVPVKVEIVFDAEAENMELQSAKAVTFAEESAILSDAAIAKQENSMIFRFDAQTSRVGTILMNPLPEEETEAAEEEEAPNVRVYEGEDYIVKATFPEEVEIPIGVRLKADLLTDELTEESIAEYLSDRASFETAKIFDIQLTADGDTYQVDAPVVVDVALKTSEEDDYDEKIVTTGKADKSMLLAMKEGTYVQLEAEEEKDGAWNHYIYTQDALSRMALLSGVNENHELSYEGFDYTVTVKYTDEAGLPDDAQLKVEEISDDRLQVRVEELEEAVAAAVEAEEQEESSIEYVRIFDIAFVVDGEEVEPAAPVQVQINRRDLADVLDDEMESGIVHFGSEEVELIDSVLSTDEDGTAVIEFEGESFSEYATYLKKFESDPYNRPAESGRPATIATIDTKSLGLDINLFDYWGDNENPTRTDLESGDILDRYWTNRTTEFFKYGINSKYGDSTSVKKYNNKNYNQAKNVLTADSIDKYLYFTSSGCSFKEDDQSALKYLANSLNGFTGENLGYGGPARQGIVKNTLNSAGYPVLATTGSQVVSLDYLFDSSSSMSGRRDYTDLNHLFYLEKINGVDYLRYSSDDHYAYLTNTGNVGNQDFKVYSTTYNNNDGSKIGFFPFNQYDPYYTQVKAPGNEGNVSHRYEDGYTRPSYWNSWQKPNKYEPNSQNHYNHHFGMTMTGDFVIPADGKLEGEDVVFKFSGDDDMWVFVDGVLVLDIGGIHEPAKGEINFTQGTVTVGAAVDTRNSSAYVMGTSNTLSNLFEQASAKSGTSMKWDGSPDSEHIIQVFYLERGGCYSNLGITMNIPFYKKVPIEVTKQLEGEVSDEVQNKEYTFQIMVEKAAGTEDGDSDYAPYVGKVEITAADGTSRIVDTDQNGYFKVKPGEMASPIGDTYVREGNVKVLKKDTHDLFLSTKRYYVNEIGVDGSVFQAVRVDRDSDPVSTDVPKDEDSYEVSGRPAVYTTVTPTKITNVTRVDYTDLKVNKVWSDSSKRSHENDSVKFKVYKVNEKDEKTLLEYGSSKQTEFVLNNRNNWTMTLTGLEKKTLLHEYEYLVEEVVPEGYKASYGDLIKGSDGNYSVTITNEPDHIHVEKKWLDFQGEESVHLAQNAPEIKIQLYRKYGTVTAENVGAPVTLNKSNDWKYSWDITDAPLSKNGKECKYYVKEVDDPDWVIVTYENNDGIKHGTITVKNRDNRSYELPYTGGAGTTINIIGGIALICSSFVLYLFNMRRRQEKRIE